MDGKKGKSSRDPEKCPTHTGAEGDEWEHRNALAQRSRNLDNVVTDKAAEIRRQKEVLRRLELEKEQLEQDRYEEKKAHLLTNLQKDKDRLRQELKDAEERHKSEMETQQNIIEKKANLLTDVQKEKDRLRQELKDAEERHKTEMETQQNIIERQMELMEELKSKMEKRSNLGQSEKRREKQAHLLTDLQKEKDQLSRELKDAEERHKFEMERMWNFMESQSAEHRKVMDQVEKHQKVKMEEQIQLQHLDERQKMLEQDREQLKQEMAKIRTEMTNMTVSEEKRGEEMALKNKICEIEEDLKKIKKERDQAKDEYERRIAGLEKMSDDFKRIEDFQKLMWQMHFNSNTPSTIHDEEILSKIRTLFVSNIIPMNVLHMFHHYNRKVLVQQDIELVTAGTSQHGNFYGAGELLTCLIRYDAWFPCLLQVLRDPKVKQDHVANAMWDALGMGDTREDNLSKEEMKTKVQTAVTIFQKLKQYHSEDGIKCLTFLHQILLDNKSDIDCIRDIGDCLTECGFAETCMKLLQDQLHIVNIQDNTKWQVLEKVCLVCVGYCAEKSRFFQKLEELGAVQFATGILRNTSFTEKLDREREGIVVIFSIGLLWNIATLAEGTISDFKDNKTVEALMPLTQSNDQTIKVCAMLALAFIVEKEEEEEEERKEKLTDRSDAIATIVWWILRALNNTRYRQHNSGLFTWDLAKGLACLAVSDINQRKIVEAGGLTVFIKILQHSDPDPDEQAMVAWCLARLATNENIRRTIQGTHGLVEALEALKETPHELLRLRVREALTVIQG